VVNSGGVETVHQGGTAVGTVINAGGKETVFSGGIDKGMRVHARGMAFINFGGTVIGGTVLSGGQLTVEAGGSVQSGLTVSGTAIIAGSVAAGQTIDMVGQGGKLVLSDLAAFQATIQDFGTLDTIDLAGFSFNAKESEHFVSNVFSTGGTLSVIDGTKQASLSLAGHYTTGSFTLASDGAGGTLVKFV
jgi:autotransporter passenger strand-loop-strand repeat protein